MFIIRIFVLRRSSVGERDIFYQKQSRLSRPNQYSDSAPSSGFQAAKLSRD
jgi:hypothetical protein